MSFIKRLIPNSVKLEARYFLLDILKMPYSRAYAPLEVLKWLPKTSPITFFDIGASVGSFTKSICAEYTIKKAILIEPVSKLIPILEKTFTDKNIFYIINAAIADTITEIDFYVNEDADFVSSLLRIDNKGEAFASLNFADPVLIKTQTLTLDHITAEHQLNYIDLLKIDVQGAEHLVLNGAPETLKKTRLVYTEFSFKPLYKDSSTLFDLYQIMYVNNFILVDLNNGYAAPYGELLQGDALFLNRDFIINTAQ